MNRQNKMLYFSSLLRDGWALAMVAMVMVGCSGRGGDDFKHVPPEDSGVDWSAEDDYWPVDTNDVYIIPDVNPEFPGGKDAMFAFLQENIRYPKEARDAKVEGKVWVRFIVERDGSISQLEVKRDIGYGCGEEALRVMRKMPKWKPGKVRDTAVRCQFFVPVKFNQ